MKARSGTISVSAGAHAAIRNLEVTAGACALDDDQHMTETFPLLSASRHVLYLYIHELERRAGITDQPITLRF